jgi:hypothetical protein
MAAILKQPQLMQSTKNIQGFSDQYLKQIADEALNDLKTQKAEDGELVFKRLRTKFEKNTASFQSSTNVFIRNPTSC